MRVATGEWNTLVPYLAQTFRCTACGVSALLPKRDGVVCGSCGASFSDPQAVLDMAPDSRPTAVHLGALASRSWGRKLWERRVWPWVLSQLADLGEDAMAAFLDAGLRPAKGPVVDLWGPTGHSLRALGRRVGVARVMAVGPTPEALREILQDTRDAGSGLVHAEPTRLPFAAGKLGAVVAMGGLGGLGPVDDVLAELSRALRGGGGLVTWTLAPTGSWLTKLWARTVGAWVGVRALELDTVREALTRAGFEPTQLVRVRHLVLVAAKRA